MSRDPRNPASNVLYNEAAMAILDDACNRLRGLGLQCGVGSDVMFPDSEMSAVLRVSTSAASLDECIAGSLLVGRYTQTPQGREEFDDALAQFRADCALGKWMYGPAANSDDNT